MYKVRKIKGEILTGRPDGMDYKTYREKRKEQQEKLKARKRGFLVCEDGKTIVGKVHELVFVD